MTQATRALVAAAFMAMMASGARADVFVVQVGDGAAALTNASTPLAVQKFTNNGTPISAIPLPTAAADQNLPFTVNGTAVSEGFLTLSGNGQFLTLAGYSIAPGTAQINTTASTVAPRAVARIDVGTGAVNTSTSFSGDTTFSAGNARSAVSSDGVSIWLAGSNQGVRTTTFGTTASTVVSSTVTNNRVLNIFNGQLYVSSGSGSFIGVNAVGTGLPTATGLATTNVVSTAGSGTGAASPYDFWFANANTLYIADDRTTTNGGGIQKWTLAPEATTWTLAYTLAVGGPSPNGTGARGLAGTFDDSMNAVLYATTGEASANRLVTITDTGAASAFTTLATAPTNTAFRGVEVTAGAVTPPSIDADFDGDLDVDGNDFVIWQRNLGTGATNAEGNTNVGEDSDVDAGDLAGWRSKFGQPVAVGAAGAVPEPASLGLVLSALAGIAALGRRR